jgi:hypothetical protein
MMNLLANLVFIGIFNLRCHIPLSKQAYCHSCLPFSDFLVHVIVLCNPFWTSFTLTFLNPINILSSFFAYWSSLEHQVPKACAFINPKNL